MPDIPGLREASRGRAGRRRASSSVPVRSPSSAAASSASEMATAYAGFGTDGHLIARQRPARRRGAVRRRAGRRRPCSELGVDRRTWRHAGPRSSAPTATAFRLRARRRRPSSRPTRSSSRPAALPRTVDLGPRDRRPRGRATGSTSTTACGCSVATARSSTGWLYAVGDVNHRALLTHQGKYQARAAGDVIAARAHGTRRVARRRGERYVATADHEAVPQVTFTDPEVASVGLTAAAAEKAGYRIRVVDYDDRQRRRGARRTPTATRARPAWSSTRTARSSLGVTFVGQDVGELLHSATIAVVGEVPLDRLWHAVPVVPDDQRGLAAAARDVRAAHRMTGRSSAGRSEPAARLPREPPRVPVRDRRRARLGLPVEHGPHRAARRADGVPRHAEAGVRARRLLRRRRSTSPTTT